MSMERELHEQFGICGNLRDEFAKAAMAACVSNPMLHLDKAKPEDVADAAYRIADAMMKRRELRQ